MLIKACTYADRTVKLIPEVISSTSLSVPLRSCANIVVLSPACYQCTMSQIGFVNSEPTPLKLWLTRLMVRCLFSRLAVLEEACLTTLLKYQQRQQTTSQLGYKCRLFSFIFGSLDHVHKLVVRAFRWLVSEKERLTLHCSISAFIGEFGEGTTF